MQYLTQVPQLLKSFYGPRHASAVVAMLRSVEYRPLKYLAVYWQTQNFKSYAKQGVGRLAVDRSFGLFVLLGALLQIVVGLTLIYGGFRYDEAGAVPFGLALIVSYPVIWAHALAVMAPIGMVMRWLIRPKRAGKHILCHFLEDQVRRLRDKHDFIVIGVAGSVGKTSTKLAIAKLLGASRRVKYQEGNYNDHLTVPLVLFGHELPALYDVVAWVKILRANDRIIRGDYPYDVVVVELGTDGPGQMDRFKYLEPELVVVTAITPEHMEYFKTLDAVAAEELTVTEYADIVLVNADDTPEKYLEGKSVQTYGFTKTTDYRALKHKPGGLKGGSLRLQTPVNAAYEVPVPILGNQGAKIVLAAVAAGELAGLTQKQIIKGAKAIEPFAGRMRILKGIKGSTLIDDTYNASPAPVIAGLDVLYDADTQQRIAILGNMNELGAYSQKAHEEVGAYCRPDKLDLIVTIGSDAERFLAPIARKLGCKVESFTNPYQAGACVKKQLRDGAVVLAEGSQNRVFAEEALKTLLADKDDARKLVRQSAYWMDIKARQFGKPPIED